MYANMVYKSHQENSLELTGFEKWPDIIEGFLDAVIKPILPSLAVGEV
jgi:hypothetical protein